MHVTNHLLLEGTSIHWHGMLMKGTPFMDGPSYVSQCPIQPFNTFTYRFIASPAGTHWYHSHTSIQRMDGLFGLLVVHESLPDIPEHLVSIGDWLPRNAIEFEVVNPYSKRRRGTGDLFLFEPNKHFTYDNNEATSLDEFGILINGRGRSGDMLGPLTNISIISGDIIRFRIAHVGAEPSFEVSFDEHEMEVLASDGHEVEPVVVDSLMIHPGERFDVIIRANRPVGNYWVRARTLRKGQGRFSEGDSIVQEGKAILRYVGSSEDDPGTSAKGCSLSDPCEVLNCPFSLFASDMYKTCLPLTVLRSATDQEQLDIVYGLQDDPEDILELFYNFAFSIGASINGRRYVEPGVPLNQDDKLDYITPCDDDTCDVNGCRCTYLEELPVNRTVQLVLSSYLPGENFMAHHPVHLHGHNFAVLAMGFAESDPATGYWTDHNPDLACLNDDLCTRVTWSGDRPHINTSNPPVKDTVIVPARGYVVVRFRTENPGDWMMHCHAEFHVGEGMVMVFNEGEDFQPPTPPKFPRCGNFDWNGPTQVATENRR